MHKYNYMKDYELAAKFGVTPQEYAVDSTKSWCLNNISNELAKMNRLKRLEMSKEITKEVLGSNSHGIEVKISPLYPNLKDEA